MNAVHTTPFKKITDVHTKVIVLYNHRLCVNGVHTLFETYLSYLRRFSLEVYISIIKKGKSSKELPKELLTNDYFVFGFTLRLSNFNAQIYDKNVCAIYYTFTYMYILCTYVRSDECETQKNGDSLKRR